MDARNPRYNHHGTIDVEIKHPTFGWIPFTADPDDPEEHGRKLYEEALLGHFGEIQSYQESN